VKNADISNIEQKDLAEKMGISQQLLSMTLAGRRTTKERLEQLVSLGIPEDLLPKLRDKKKQGSKALPATAK
jgi:transcriptional regulator with XRE-family HTH domain